MGDYKRIDIINMLNTMCSEIYDIEQNLLSIRKKIDSISSDLDKLDVS